MTLRITQYGESILHQDGKVVSSFGTELTVLANQMLEAMDNAGGIGLAAQQIGQAIRFCVVDVPEHPDYPMTCILDGKPLFASLLMPMALANPEVSPRKFEHPVFDQDGNIKSEQGRLRLSPYFFYSEGSANHRGTLATFCPADKKIIHGMKDGALMPCDR